MMNNKNILLFPGGFKPFHDGHLSILKAHIFNMDNVRIDEARIYVSKKDRDIISANSTIWFLSQIYENIMSAYDINLCFMIPDFPSPIRQCYIDVGSDTSSKFALVASTKENDYQRSIDFANAYNETGKYYIPELGPRCFTLNVNIEPLVFRTRTDYNNGDPVSSTILRTDIKNNDFENFVSGYTNMLNEKIVNMEILKLYFKRLHGI